MCASLNEARTAEPWPEVRKWTLRRLRSIRNSREINLDKIVGAAAGSRRAAFQLQVNASPGHDIIDLRFCTGPLIPIFSFQGKIIFICYMIIVGRWWGLQRSDGKRSPKQSQPLSFETRARSEEHTSELQSLMRSSYAVFCLKKKNRTSRESQ